MSELDTSLQELRDDLRSSITRPDLARVAGRARQRDVRRRMQIGAITAVVLVSVTVPVLRSLSSERPPADQAVSATMRYHVDFANATHGYALGNACAESAGDPCVFSLLATSDAGRTWQPRTLPANGMLTEQGGMTVLDADHLVVYAPAPAPSTYAARYKSDDAGRTWRESSLLTREPLQIPAGAELTQLCGVVGDCASGLGTVGVDDRAAFLPTQPPLADPQPGRSSTAGGRYWVAGKDRSTDRWAISVTSDEGKTWSTTLVDPPGEPYVSGMPWSVVENNGVMYATVVGAIGAGPFGLLAVYRSTDKGMSWTATWQASETNILIAVDGSPIATADGRLLVQSTVGGTLESQDGQTFTVAEYQLPGLVMWTRAGYLAAGKDNSYQLSSDGRVWRSFDIR